MFLDECAVCAHAIFMYHGLASPDARLLEHTAFSGPRKSGSYTRPDSLLSCPLNVMCGWFCFEPLSSISFHVHILVPGLRMRAQVEVHDVLI